MARLLQSQVENIGGFIGHIGGDDFMLLLSLPHWESVVQQVWQHVESMAPGFYEASDRSQGGVQVENRQGNIAFFPFFSVSVAVKPVTPLSALKALGHCG